MKSQEELQTAANYLANNKGLRCALGIADETFLQPAFLGAGEHNRNFVFCDPATRKKFVLRINVAPQSFHSNQVAYEAEALRVLGQTDRAPKVLYVDSSKRLLNYNALVISFCEGRMLHYDHLQEGDLERAVRIWPTSTLRQSPRIACLLALKTRSSPYSTNACNALSCTWDPLRKMKGSRVGRSALSTLCARDSS